MTCSALVSEDLDGGVTAQLHFSRVRDSRFQGLECRAFGVSVKQ